MTLINQLMEGGARVREVHSASVDAPSITTLAEGTVAVTIAGITTSDVVLSINPIALDAGLIVKNAACTTDTVTFTIANYTAGTINGSARTYYFEILRNAVFD